MSKSPLFRIGEKNEIVIRNPYADPDHQQKLITPRGSSVTQVLSTSVSAFVSYPVCRMTDGMTQHHITSAWLAEVSN